MIPRMVMDNGYKIKTFESLYFFIAIITPNILPINNPNKPHKMRGFADSNFNRLSVKRNKLKPRYTKAFDKKKITR